MSCVLDHNEILAQLGILDTATDTEKNIVANAVSRAEGAVQRYLNYNPVYTTHPPRYYPQGDYSIRNSPVVWEVEGGSAVARHLSEASTDLLYVKHIPIRSITSLHIDYDGRFGTKSGAFGASTLKTIGEDFWPQYDGQDSSGNPICRDGTLRSIGRWPVEPGSVKIVYTAGYTLDELLGNDTVIDASPIYEAMIIEANRRAKEAFLQAKQFTAGGSSLGFSSGEITSERLGDYSYNRGTSSGSRGSTSDRLHGNLYGLTQQSRELLAPFINYGYQLAG